MEEIPKQLKWLLFGRGALWHARVAWVFNLLGMVFLIVGIVGDAINRVPGLEPTNWFIMAVGFWVLGFWVWSTAYTAAKEG